MRPKLNDKKGTHQFHTIQFTDKAIINLKDINKNYATPLDDRKFIQEDKHTDKSIEKEVYNKEYYLNGQPGWIQSTCGVRPYLDAKGFVAIANAILENHIYVQSRTDFFENDTNEFKNAIIYTYFI